MSSKQASNFIHWLRKQHNRSDTVGELARSLRSDPVSSRLSTRLELSKRLNQDEASWEFHDALEHAEREWQVEAHVWCAQWLDSLMLGSTSGSVSGVRRLARQRLTRQEREYGGWENRGSEGEDRGCRCMTKKKK